MNKKRGTEVLGELSGNELKLVKYLARHSDRNGIAILNVKSASSELKIGEDKLRELTKSLVKKGLISIETQQEIEYLRVDKNFQNLILSSASQALSKLKDLESEINDLDKTLGKLRKSFTEFDMKLEELSKIVEQIREAVSRTIDEFLSNMHGEFELIKARHLIGELDEESYRHVERINTSASNLATEVMRSVTSALQDSGEVFESVKKTLDEYTNILNTLLKENLMRIRSHLQQNFKILDQIIKNMERLSK